MPEDPRRALPPVNALLGHDALVPFVAAWGHGPVVRVVRRVVAAARGAVAEGEPPPSGDELAAAVGAELRAWDAARLRAVVNATGVVLHTNLGRAPLSAAARDAVLAATGYCTVELDLATGARGRRGAAAETLLREVTGAAAALVVNNAAAALLLALDTVARGREVVVSRGELIEIGGEFRLPAIMEAAGVAVVEVGTTNRTHLRDYAAALTDRTALVLVVHPSNYRVDGFTARPPLAEVAALAHRHGLPLLHDVGSGLIDGGSGVVHAGSGIRGDCSAEPSVRASVADADLTLFSGDKLLGGPQAGLVVGDEELIARMRRHPVARAVRIDKLNLAALEATLRDHLAGRAAELPVWRALRLSPESLRERCEALAGRIGRTAAVEPGHSVAGGGSLPGEGLPSLLVTVDTGAVGESTVLARLRANDPPVVARAGHGRLILDLRTVPPDQDDALTTAVLTALGRDTPPAP